MFRGWINSVRPPPVGAPGPCSLGALTTRDMPKTHDSIQAAQEIVGDGLDLNRLDQIFDLQRLLGPVIAYKRLLEIVINSSDDKEVRMAAAKLLDHSSEDPERIAERLRASIFSELTLEELEAVVDTGITDPQRALKLVKP